MLSKARLAQRQCLGPTHSDSWVTDPKSDCKQRGKTKGKWRWYLRVLLDEKKERNCVPPDER